ncbi:MAG: NAD(P)-dependent oxidoreductase, partial [Candidatus Roizmanbacteria bacterium]
MKFVAIDSPFIREKYLNQVKDLPQISDYFSFDDAPENQEDIVRRIGDAEMITLDIFQQITKDVLDRTPHLKAIFSQAVGTNNIDAEYAKGLGIKVYNCPGYNANAVAEFVFALITSLFRKIPAAQAHVRAGGWMYRYFEGRELRGRTIGVIGSGNVARKVVSIARGYGMNICVHTQNPNEKKALALEIKKFSTLKDVLKTADFLVLCVPLTPSTKHLLGKKELALMKKTAILVNVSVLSSLSLTSI